MEDMQEIIAGLTQELRRGTVVLGALSQLKQPCYGYSLVQSLSESGVPIDAGTLYPLLRRLEKQGLLQSEWETSGAKPRKYYRLSPQGVEAYEALRKVWQEMTRSMAGLMEKGEEQ